VCCECVLRGRAGRRGQNAVIVVSSPVGNSSRRNGGSIGVIGVARHLNTGSSEQCLYRSRFSGPDAGRTMSREGRKTAGDGIDNPYRVEGRLGAKPQVAAAAQRQPGARVDKPFRLGADGGRGHAGTRANRWRAKALSDAFAAMGVEGVVGRIRIELGRPQRIDNQRIHRPPGGGKSGERGALAPW
jgi:hypothetical protein